MPKNRSRIKTREGALIVNRPTSKFRIGSRKGGKSALLMTNEQLHDVLKDENKKRYWHNARAVLEARTVPKIA